jgi:hypothetical protein
VSRFPQSRPEGRLHRYSDLLQKGQGIHQTSSAGMAHRRALVVGLLSVLCEESRAKGERMLRNVMWPSQMRPLPRSRV